jgi:hypothetical protein
MSSEEKDLTEALAGLRAQVDVQDRSYKGHNYPVCFVGTEATEILAIGRSRSEAIQARAITAFPILEDCVDLRVC